MNKLSAIIFGMEWLIVSVIIGETLSPELKFIWYIFMVWVIIGIIPLLLWAIKKEEARNEEMQKM